MTSRLLAHAAVPPPPHLLWLLPSSPYRSWHSFAPYEAATPIAVATEASRPGANEEAAAHTRAWSSPHPRAMRVGVRALGDQGHREGRGVVVVAVGMAPARAPPPPLQLGQPGLLALPDECRCVVAGCLAAAAAAERAAMTQVFGGPCRPSTAWVGCGGGAAATGWRWQRRGGWL